MPDQDGDDPIITSTSSFAPISTTSLVAPSTTTSSTTTSPTTTSSQTTSFTTTPAQVSSTTTSSITCPTLTCPSSSRTCPPCQTGFVCRLSVIDASCECPVASCVKPAFDTGANSSNSGSGFGGSNNTTNNKSLLVPVLGGVVGLIAVIAVALLIIRYKRSKTTNGDAMLDQQGKQDRFGNSYNNRDTKFNDENQSWRGLSSDTMRQKDVIRIGYVPSMHEDQRYRIPGIAQLGGGPRASFFAEEDDKHSSLASSLETGVLDEAISVAISNIATPKLLQLDNIKVESRGMIQKSNSLHSSNSLRRSQSQSRAIERKETTTGSHGIGAGVSTGETHRYSHYEQNQQFTPAVMVTAPSTRSSAQSTASATLRPRPPSMVLEPRPLHSNYNAYQSTSSPTSTHGQSKAAVTPLGTTLAPISTTSPPPSSFSSSSSSSNSRIHSVLMRHAERGREYEYNTEVLRRSRTDGGYGVRNNVRRTTRSSMFSTQSDSRSTTTRGDGEEIMIFWDGNRHSRASSNM
ncbi:hypothetical protein EDD21DRAFT_360358 [Dissophora ornata]|nr:hypothetical protein EDD21DRAFT_360358 [Dissophora ornata]